MPFEIIESGDNILRVNTRSGMQAAAWTRRARLGLGTALLFSAAGALCFAADAPPKQLPDGPGKEALERVCSACHGAEIVTGKGLTKDGWTQVVEEMIQRGAQGSEDDFAQIVDYLAKNFPPSGGGAAPAAAVAQKVNVNKASADDLKTGLELTPGQASAIVDYRQKNGDFKSLDDLKKVPGLDAAKLDAEKDKISFSD